MDVEELSKHFQNINLVTNVAKFRSFQCRLLHHAIVLNPYQNKCKMVNDETCSFCKNAVETIQHFMWECPIIQMLWARVISIFTRTSV